MERIALILIPACLLLSSPLAAQDASAQSPEQSKQALKNIQSQVEERKKELELYKKKQHDISRYIDFLKRQENSAEADKKKLEREEDQAGKLLRETERRSVSLNSSMKHWSALAAGELRAYYLDQLNYSFQYYGSSHLSQQMYRQAALYQKVALMDQLRGESERTQRQMSVWKRTSRELVDRSNKLKQEGALRRERYEKNLSDLNSAKERQARLEREIDGLKNSARSLQVFLQSFTKKHAPVHARATTEPNTTIAAPRHSLQWPVQGEIVSAYGREPVPSLKTWIMREGIKIAVAQGTPVHAVADGEVIYAGPFRSYGNVVMVDHKRGYFTIYGMLSSIGVQKGEQVTAGQELGAAGDDTESSYNGSRTVLYFEIRSGTSAVNPVDWLQAK
jgi:septal ring factor EnvC (AmiA/AmiB activator)